MGHAPRDHEPRGGAFARFSWMLLDWAASAFSTVLITLVVTYVEKVALPEGAFGMDAGVVWSWTMAAAMFVSAVIAPWAAAWADRRDAHQRALVAGTAVGVGGLLALAAIAPTASIGVVTAVIAACLGFDIAQVFTGSLLPRIATGRAADRLSAAGFAAGYAGGGIALVAVTAIVTAHARFGIDIAGGLRLAFAFTAAWWLVFSLPAAVARFGGGDGARHASNPGRELLAFARSLIAPPDAAVDGRFAAALAGSMLALGAIQTAITQFTSLALQRFDLDGPALVRLVLLVQAVALPGALGVGWLAARWGRRIAVTVCMAGWLLVLALAWFVRTPAELHGLAVLLALVLGGAQSVIRAAVATLAPAGRSGVTFGLLHVGTKLAGCGAGLAFGMLQLATGNPQTGLVALVLQLLAAWWLLRRII